MSSWYILNTSIEYAVSKYEVLYVPGCFETDVSEIEILSLQIENRGEI